MPGIQCIRKPIDLVTLRTVVQKYDLSKRIGGDVLGVFDFLLNTLYSLNT